MYPVHIFNFSLSECTMNAKSPNPTEPRRRKRPGAGAAASKERANIVCDICGRQSQSAAALKIHMMMHTREYPYKCPLPGCGKGYPTKTALKL